jgi:hypothetical protein
MLKQIRQEKALKRLEQQLESRVKTKKGTRDEKEPLTDGDIKRINNEILVLKKKMK